MINFIKGEIVKKGLDYVVVENHGMGYYIHTSTQTLNKISECEHVNIFTYMHIREDILALYGFLTTEEIDIFKKLISVNGVGPKAGLAVLSTYEINSIREIIIKDDATRMSKVPGIGKKTASKIILELKDKVGTLDSINIDENEIVNKSFEYEDGTSDIITALISLGFGQLESKKALESIDISNKSENEIIKEALKIIKA